MTQAAEQCRQYIEANFDGVRISRYSCRDTASGGISQHSAYQPGDYDSNALDIMGGPLGWTWEQNVELIQKIVDDLTPNLYEWSIRKILWGGRGHRGHAHIDFYPMIDIHRWCSTVGVTPPWKYSDGHVERHDDPEPENGSYNGTEQHGMPYEQFVNLVKSLFAGRPDEFHGNPAYFYLTRAQWFAEYGNHDGGIYDEPEHVDWANFWNAFVDSISLEGGTP